MARRMPAIVEVELVDPLAAFRLRWREILAQLPARSLDSLPSVQGNGGLGQLQAQLLKVLAGEPVDPIDWIDDGSVTIVRGKRSSWRVGGWRPMSAV